MTISNIICEIISFLFYFYTDNTFELKMMIFAVTAGLCGFRQRYISKIYKEFESVYN